MENLRMQEMNSVSEKDRLNQEYEALKMERNDIASRMSELTAKYEIYVQTMSKEREELVQGNRLHIRLLTSKLLVIFLEGAIHRRKKHGLMRIKKYSDEATHHTRSLRRMFNVFEGFKSYEEKLYLRRWYLKVFNFSKENTQLNTLVERKSNL
jgi:hypothetical protein